MAQQLGLPKLPLAPINFASIRHPPDVTTIFDVALDFASGGARDRDHHADAMAL